MDKSIELIEKVLEKSTTLSEKSSINFDNSIKFYSSLYGIDYKTVINKKDVRKIS